VHVFGTAALIKVVRFRVIIDYFHLDGERASEELLEFSISNLELRGTNTIGTVQQERRLILSLLGVPEQLGEIVEIVGPSLVEVC
jgi:hypothetical protein